MKKTIFLVLLGLLCSVGTLLAEDFTITPITGSYLSPGNIAKITYSGDMKISSTQIQTTDKNKSGTFTVTTNAPDMYIKSVTFTDVNYGGSKQATISKTAGGGTLTSSSGSYTYTGASGNGDLTISVTAGTGGAAKLGSVSIVVSNGSTNSMVTMATFSASEGVITASSVTCNASSVSAPITITSTQWTISSNNISVPSSNDSKTITISSTSGSHLKYIAFLDSQCRLGITETSSTGGSTDGASWTADDDETTSVTFKNSIGTSLTVTKIYVITEEDIVPPTITTQPVSASYVTNASATALSVEATGTGTLHYQWYSNNTGTAAPATDTAIDGATNASYSPSTASAGTKYYYCVVTDNNGSTTSSVATITVSAATPPTISISGDASVTRGGDLTLTANITGVPDPDINWYASTSEGEKTGESLGTASTYVVPSTTVGTYYFVAIANNGVGGDEDHNVVSAKKTVKVLPKAPTLTAGGIFTDDSKSVTISKADGESGDAVIKYSTDDGANWETYSETLSITATTTVTAKVVQSTLESAEASATYSKVVLDVQTNVSGAKVWNWADLVGKYTATSGSDLKLADDGKGDSKNTEVLMSNVPKYGRYTINYPASFDAQSLLFNGEYIVRKAGDDYVAGAVYLKFTTTVAGIITVEYADNGTNNRYVRITDADGSYNGDASSSTSDYKTFSHAVAAGEIKLAGYDGSKDNYIRFKKITFTPSTVTPTPDGYATFVAPFKAQLSANVKSFIGTYDDNGSLTLTELTGNSDVVPENAPVVLKSTSSPMENITISIASKNAGTFTAADNDLEAGPVVRGSHTDYYVLGRKNDATKFFQFNGDMIPSNKAYLEITNYPAAAPGIRIIVEENNATNVNNIESTDEIVKFIQNGQLLIKRDGVVYDAMGRVIR